MKLLRTEEILKKTDHRNMPFPNSDWEVYSEWKNVLMLHWKINASEIKHLLPDSLSVDTFEGGAWITMCISSVENFKNKLLSIIRKGLKFNQVTMQTYVISKGKSGIYIFNQELEKSFSQNFIHRLFKMQIGETEFQRENGNGVQKIFASNKQNGFKLGIQYRFGEPIQYSPLEQWLSNRFNYFLPKDDHLFEYPVHHVEYLFRDVNVEKFKTEFTYGGINLNHQPDFIHYSKGIQKLFWPKILIK